MFYHIEKSTKIIRSITDNLETFGEIKPEYEVKESEYPFKCDDVFREVSVEELQAIQQEKINQESRAFLNSNDWPTIKFIEQMFMSDLTVPQELKDLWVKKQEKRDEVTD